VAAVRHWGLGAGPGAGAGVLAAWAERTGCGAEAEPGHGGLRFVFYGRVSTEDYQDPVTSLARQREPWPDESCLIDPALASSHRSVISLCCWMR